MNPMTLQHNRKDKPRLALSFDKLGVGIFLYAYAVFLGACYLFAYWRPIGFNVFPYLGLQDYIGAALNRVVVLVAPPLIFAVIIFGGDRETRKKFGQQIVPYLAALYCISFAQEFYKAISRYLTTHFYFTNEITVLLITALMFLTGIASAVYCWRSLAGLPVQIAALVLLQSASSMAAGYGDGKAVYNGAMNVHFLENKELCEPGGVRDWVLLGTFSDQTFFMNTIDKRLCLTDEKKIRLISRQLKELPD
jgi:TRAP-type C4-dicarboxylate transport system permease small subunit